MSRQLPRVAYGFISSLPLCILSPRSGDLRRRRVEDLGGWRRFWGAHSAPSGKHDTDVSGAQSDFSHYFRGDLIPGTEVAQRLNLR